MAANSIPELLAKLSKAKLKAMEQSLEGQITDLTTQKEWVVRALIDKGVRPKPPGMEEKPTKRRKRTGRTGSSAIIRDLIQEDPERLWMPIEIIRAAHDRGVSSNPQSIRVALRRMGEQGFLERGPEGKGWKLASSNGSAEESSSEAQTSGPGGMGG